MAKEKEVEPSVVMRSFRMSNLLVIDQHSIQTLAVPKSPSNLVTQFMEDHSAQVQLGDTTMEFTGNPQLLAEYIHPDNPNFKRFPRVKLHRIFSEDL